jgi:hypothetical protein
LADVYYLISRDSRKERNMKMMDRKRRYKERKRRSIIKMQRRNRNEAGNRNV